MSEPVSTENGSVNCYTVEARVKAGHGPVTENGQLFDREWRGVRFQRAEVGISSGLFNAFARERGYLSQDSAMALAWGFLAECDSFAIEARLVEHCVSYHVEIARVVDGPAIERSVWSLQQRIVNGIAKAREEHAKSASVNPSA